MTMTNETKKKIGMHSKERWKDPEYRAKVTRTINTVEFKVAQKNRAKKMWQDPDYLDSD